MKNEARKQYLDDDSGKRKYKIGDDAGGEHIACSNGAHVEAPQDTLFAEHDQGGAKSPKASHYCESDYRTQKILNVARHAFCKDSGIEKEKAERHDHAEEQKHFIAQRELNAHAGECHEVCQSRNLLPVISMKTSSSEGEAISRLTSSLPCASRCLTSATTLPWSTIATRSHSRSASSM